MPLADGNMNLRYSFPKRLRRFTLSERMTLVGLRRTGTNGLPQSGRTVSGLNWTRVTSLHLSGVNSCELETFVIGDRNDGKIEVRNDKLFIGKSRYRDTDKVISLTNEIPKEFP